MSLKCLLTLDLCENQPCIVIVEITKVIALVLFSSELICEVCKYKLADCVNYTNDLFLRHMKQTLWLVIRPWKYHTRSD